MKEKEDSVALTQAVKDLDDHLRENCIDYRNRLRDKKINKKLTNTLSVYFNQLEKDEKNKGGPRMSVALPKNSTINLVPSKSNQKDGRSSFSVAKNSNIL